MARDAAEDCMNVKNMTPPSESESRARNQSERVRVHSRHVLSDGWATLEQVVFDYQRNDGRWQEQHREIYHRGHGSAILLYNRDKRTIVLTRQFRFPAWTLGGDGLLLEVPAGIIENGDAQATIRAETEQETGFLIEPPEFLFRAYATPGSVTEQLFYFAAAYDATRRSGTGGGVEEEGEDIEVLEVELEQAVEWIASGEIMDAKTIVLIQYAQLHVFGN